MPNAIAHRCLRGAFISDLTPVEFHRNHPDEPDRGYACSLTNFTHRWDSQPFPEQAAHLSEATCPLPPHCGQRAGPPRAASSRACAARSRARSRRRARIVTTARLRRLAQRAGMPFTCRPRLARRFRAMSSSPHGFIFFHGGPARAAAALLEISAPNRRPIRTALTASFHVLRRTGELLLASDDLRAQQTERLRYAFFQHSE
jgi:hypothetical protein